MVLVAVFTLLAVFSIISIVMSAEETGTRSDPRDDPFFWAAYGRR
jgi:hypothetical protein